MTATGNSASTTGTSFETPEQREPQGKKSFEQRFAEALRRRLYPNSRLRLKTLARDTGYSEDTITRWTQAKHRVFAGALEDVAMYFATRHGDRTLLQEVFGHVAHLQPLPAQAAAEPAWAAERRRASAVERFDEFAIPAAE